MIAGRRPHRLEIRWAWWLAFGLLAAYVAVRMGVLALSADVPTRAGTVRLPNTFASVDHPFHVARAEVLWRELASGRLVRWIGQHQGGYPVEFYPLGEAWLEVLARGLSLGTLPAESAHTLAVAALFLAPGAAFAALARADGWSPAVGFTAFALHVSLPGGWYHGGYTELVQWGLVTNVAGAVAALSVLPAIVRFLRTGASWSIAVAAPFAAFAIYSNPRSILALVAVGLGTWLAVIWRGYGIAPRRRALAVGDSSPGDDAGPGIETPPLHRFIPDATEARATLSFGAVSMRLVQWAALTALLAAPELMALARFRDLYTFVQYSGYAGLVDYAATSVNAVTWPVLALGLLGLTVGLVTRQRPATASAAAALVLYLLMTSALAVAPAVAGLAPQLEPTRLMPLQRFLTLYLAAVGSWIIVSSVNSRISPLRPWLAPVLAVGAATAILLVQTRSLAGPLLDPASPDVPETSLFPVSMSASPEQADLEGAIRAADEAAPPGTALLVLGSALSWHQQLWAPLWTARPLYYDNWLWYWHPDHAGTPAYAFRTGHHYPDPEQTLDRDYLGRHGIGAVALTGYTRDTAAASPHLDLRREGVYDVYAVIDPVTVVTFGDQNAADADLANERVEASSARPGSPVAVRVNWHPRWRATGDDGHLEVERLGDGYIGIERAEPLSRAELAYSVQPLDWVARILSLAGLIALGALFLRRGTPGSWIRAGILRRGGRRSGPHLSA